MTDEIQTQTKHFWSIMETFNTRDDLSKSYPINPVLTIYFIEL